MIGSSITLNVMLGTALLGTIAGIIGTFAVLRRRALVGDMLSHAALPGICTAFLIMGNRNMLGLSLGREILTTHFEAWLLIVSGVIILGIAAWMFWRTGRILGWFRRHHFEHHHHSHDGHRHHNEVRMIDTGHGVVELSGIRQQRPPNFGQATDGK